MDARRLPSGEGDEAVCVVYAPQDMVEGRTAGERARSFNTKVIAKLPSLPGMLYKPEAVSIRAMGGNREGGSLWAVEFGHRSDVGKMMAYKPVLARTEGLKRVFIRPMYTREEMSIRKRVHSKVDDYVKGLGQQAAEWKFRWGGATKGSLVHMRGEEVVERLMVTWVDGSVRIGEERRGAGGQA